MVLVAAVEIGRSGGDADAGGRAKQPGHQMGRRRERVYGCVCVWVGAGERRWRPASALHQTEVEEVRCV